MEMNNNTNNKKTDSDSEDTEAAIALVDEMLLAPETPHRYGFDNSRKIRPGAIMFMRGFLLSPEKEQEKIFENKLNDRSKMIFRGIIDSFDFRYELHVEENNYGAYGDYYD